MGALKIEVLCTGHELLDGSIADTNTQRLAVKLRSLGLRIQRTTIVPDETSQIAEAATQAASRSQYVIVSGGLGPTSDDITLEAIAHAFGREMVFHKEAKANVLARLRFLKRKIMNKSQQKQFYAPAHALILRNDFGTAPGVQVEFGKTIFFFLPGVPREFNHLLEKYLIPFFETKKDREFEYLFQLKVLGWPESLLNELMKKMKVPKGVEIGYRTSLPENHIKFHIRSASKKAAEKKLSPLIRKLENRISESGMCWREHTFEEEVLIQLLKQKSVVSTAESCTGGQISSMMTSVSGASKVFDRGFITYSNEAKIDLLGVKEKTLIKYGAVSEETAIEMAKGALKNSKATKSVAVTGIAGPAGGTKQKPVGTVWIAAATATKVRTKLLKLNFSRELNQRYSAFEALRLLIEI